MIGQKVFDAARALFKSFHEREARPREIVIVKPAAADGAIALEVGTALTIGYRALGDGKAYYHEFEASKPKLYVSADGKQIFLVGGSYTFTDRGFIK